MRDAWAAAIFTRMQMYVERLKLKNSASMNIHRKRREISYSCRLTWYYNSRNNVTIFETKIRIWISSALLRILHHDQLLNDFVGKYDDQQFSHRHSVQFPIETLDWSGHEQRVSEKNTVFRTKNSGYVWRWRIRLFISHAFLANLNDKRVRWTYTAGPSENRSEVTGRIAVSGFTPSVFSW